MQERAVEILSPAKLRPFSLSTNPYPGFPTDLQPQMVAVATQAHGQSELEAVFDKRFGYTAELKKLGAHIDSKEQAVVVHGPTHLKANTLLAGDLRGGAALVLAALAAGGSTTIEGVDHIDRGYESMETRLLRLGASVKRIAN